jgi:hypothetical protein
MTATDLRKNSIVDRSLGLDNHRGTAEKAIRATPDDSEAVIHRCDINRPHNNTKRERRPQWLATEAQRV